MPIRPWLGALLSILLTSRALASPPKSEVEAVVIRFYSAWANGDARTYDRLRAPHTDALRARWMLSPSGCRELEGIALRKTTIQGQRAVVIADALFRQTAGPRSRMAIPELQQSTFVLEKNGERWRIREWTIAEEQLADEMVAAPFGERPAILRSHPELQTAALARALAQRTVTLVNRSRIDDARQLVEFAAVVADDAADLATQSLVLGARSVLARQPPRPDIELSISLANESVAVAERSGEPDALGRALLRVGRAAQSRDGIVRTEAYERLLATEDQIADRSIVALAETQMAQAAAQRGEEREAIRHAELAAGNAAASGDVAALLSASQNIAGFYFEQGDYALARDHYERALAIARRSEFPTSLLSMLDLLARCHMKLGFGAKALVATNEALRYVTAETAPHDLADLLETRGLYFLSVGNLRKAEGELTESVCQARNSGHVVSISKTLNALARLRVRQGRYREALSLSEEAFELRRIPQEIAAVVLRRLGLNGQAERILREQLEWIDEAHRNVAGNERQTRLLSDDQAAVPRELVDLLVEEGRISEALQVFEQLKAGTVRDLIASDHRGPTGTMNAAQRHRYRALNQRIVFLNKSLLEASSDHERATLHSDLDRARAEFNDFLVRTAAGRPAHWRERVASSQISIDIPPQFSRTAIIEYFVGSERTIIFTIRHRASATRIRARIVNLGAAGIAEESRRFLDRIETRDLDYRESARRIYRLLVQPVEADLEGAGSICIV